MRKRGKKQTRTIWALRGDIFFIFRVLQEKKLLKDDVCVRLGYGRVYVSVCICVCVCDVLDLLEAEND